MSAFARTNWERNRNALAAEMPIDEGSGAVSMRERFLVVRDTLIVLAMQLTFRVSTLLRHFNY
jgi:hypothetical protein